MIQKLHRLVDLRSGVGLSNLFGQSSEAKTQYHQALPSLIVQLAADAFSFFFLHAHQIKREIGRWSAKLVNVLMTLCVSSSTGCHRFNQFSPNWAQFAGSKPSIHTKCLVCSRLRGDAILKSITSGQLDESSPSGFARSIGYNPVQCCATSRPESRMEKLWLAFCRACLPG